GMTLLALLLLAGAGYGVWRALGWGWWWPPWGPDYARLVADAEREQTQLTTELAALRQSLGGRRARRLAHGPLAAGRAQGARVEGAASVLEDRMAAALELCGVRGQLAAAEADRHQLESALAATRDRLSDKLDACRVAAAEKQEKQKAEEAARKAEAKRKEE